MIRTEIAIFVALFASGLGAGMLASFLLALGRGSRVARAIFDAVTPLAVGAIYFFALKGAASGVFRLYSALAFLLGGSAAWWIVGRISPYLSRAISRLKVPIKSLEDKLSERIYRRFSPFRKKRAAKRAIRAARRKEKTTPKTHARAAAEAQDEVSG